MEEGGEGGGLSREDVFFHHLKKDLFMFFFEIFGVVVTEFVFKKMWKIVPPPKMVFFLVIRFKSLFQVKFQGPLGIFFHQQFILGVRSQVRTKSTDAGRVGILR